MSARQPGTQLTPVKIPPAPWGRAIFYSPLTAVGTVLAGVGAFLIDPYRPWMIIPFAALAYVSLVLLRSGARAYHASRSTIYAKNTSPDYPRERNELQREINLLSAQLRTQFALDDGPLSDARELLGTIQNVVDVWDRLSRRADDMATLSQVVRSYFPAAATAYASAERAASGPGGEHRSEFRAQVKIMQDHVSAIAERAQVAPPR